VGLLVRSRYGMRQNSAYRISQLEIAGEIMTKWQRARLVVKQLRSGEWTPVFNKYSDAHITAERNDCELWIAAGPWFLDIIQYDKNTNAFGLIFRHYVWWAAARKFKRDADFNHKKKCSGKIKDLVDLSLMKGVADE
jgi:hypothetical protein